MKGETFLQTPLDLSKFEKQNRIFFQSKELLKRVFTHSSYAHKNALEYNNERLEFLGDSIIQMIVTLHLYKKLPNHPEGALTNYRSALVNTASFAETAKELEMEKYLYFSNQAAQDTIRRILANTFEALIGAIYLDQGYNSAEIFVSKCLFQKLDAIVQRNLWRDWKGMLQEKAHKHMQITPIYAVISETGPSNDRTFICSAKVGSFEKQGSGKSKREAEKDAAHQILKIKGWL